MRLKITACRNPDRSTRDGDRRRHADDPAASFSKVRPTMKNQTTRQSDAPSFAELFTPKLVTVLREGYGVPQLRADAIAGLTVAIVALPLSMAIAIASGVSPGAGALHRHRRRLPRLACSAAAASRSADRPAPSSCWWPAPSRCTASTG